MVRRRAENRRADLSNGHLHTPYWRNKRLIQPFISTTLAGFSVSCIVGYFASGPRGALHDVPSFPSPQLHETPQGTFLS